MSIGVSKRGHDIIWMVQVRNKFIPGNRWSATSPEWFYTRKDALKYIAIKITPTMLEYYEYRAQKYEAVRP